MRDTETRHFISSERTNPIRLELEIAEREEVAVTSKVNNAPIWAREKEMLISRKLGHLLS